MMTANGNNAQADSAAYLTTLGGRIIARDDITHELET
jgi:hypothetical protein